MFTAIHKYYTTEQWKEFADENPEVLEHVAVSCGAGEDDFKHLKEVLEIVPQLSFIVLDVANGYMQHFIDFVRRVRSIDERHASLPVVRLPSILENGSIVEVPIDKVPTVFMIPGMEGNTNNQDS